MLTSPFTADPRKIQKNGLETVSVETEVLRGGKFLTPTLKIVSEP